MNWGVGIFPKRLLLVFCYPQPSMHSVLKRKVKVIDVNQKHDMTWIQEERWNRAFLTCLKSLKWYYECLKCSKWNYECLKWSNVCVQKAFNLLIYKCQAAKVASVFCFICGAHMIWPRKFLPKNMKKIPVECACFGLYLKIFVLIYWPKKLC